MCPSESFGVGSAVVACLNMFMLVIFDVSQFKVVGFAWAVSKNMFCVFVRLDVFQLVVFGLAAVAALNIENMLVTLLVSQVLQSGSAWGYAIEHLTHCCYLGCVATVNSCEVGAAPKRVLERKSSQPSLDWE